MKNAIFSAALFHLPFFEHSVSVSLSAEVASHHLNGAP